MDIYYAMNQKLFDPELQFYSDSPKSHKHSLPTVLETLAALGELRYWLPGGSQVQLQWLVQPWKSGVKATK